MKKPSLALLVALACTSAAAAEPHYASISMEIDVAAPAEAVWAKVGKFCDISAWMKVDCVIASGDGGLGTVRRLAGGRVTEVLVARTALSYVYAQPARPGEFYNLYHGMLEARPVSRDASKLVYTIMLDLSDKPDQAAQDADLARRRAMFESALQNMKVLAEDR